MLPALSGCEAQGAAMLDAAAGGDTETFNRASDRSCRSVRGTAAAVNTATFNSVLPRGRREAALDWIFFLLTHFRQLPVQFCGVIADERRARTGTSLCALVRGAIGTLFTEQVRKCDQRPPNAVYSDEVN